SGALPIFAAILGAVGSRPLADAPAPALAERWIDYGSGAEVGPRCADAVSLLLPRDASLPRGRCGFGISGACEWLRDAVNRAPRRSFPPSLSRAASPADRERVV